jgi:branched-subunit amino acid aminotransferase/4-amino-4-deoxychorismate lyase
LFEIAPEAGVALTEQTIHLEDLYSADEVFITSTNRNLIAVGEIAGRRIPTVGHGVTSQLRELFEVYLDEYVSRRLASSSSAR